MTALVRDPHQPVCSAGAGVVVADREGERAREKDRERERARKQAQKHQLEEKSTASSLEQLHDAFTDVRG